MFQDVYGAAKSSVANQALMQQQRGRDFLKGGGLIGHMYRNNKRLKDADTVRRKGIDNKYLQRAEFATAGSMGGLNSMFSGTGSSLQSSTNYSAGLVPKGGKDGDKAPNNRFAKEVSTATKFTKILSRTGLCSSHFFGFRTT